MSGSGVNPANGAAGKVTGAHLARAAFLYVRQSTLRQVLTNTESATRQYALRQRAIALGWPAERIVTIDTDQGQSGASAADREGFQRLVAEVGMGRRRDRVGPGGIPAGPQQRRLAPTAGDLRPYSAPSSATRTASTTRPTSTTGCCLGLKGTMSQKPNCTSSGPVSAAGNCSKARRGELQDAAAGRAGLRPGRQRDPRSRHRRASKPSRHLFALFARTGIARAVVQNFNPQGLLFPVRVRTGPRKGELAWMPLQHWRVLRTLHNPRYAGAFVYGRRRERQHRRRQSESYKLLPREEWIALIPDAHPGYISWDTFEPTRRLLSLPTLTPTASDRRRRTRPGRHRPAARPRHLRALRRPDERALPHPPRHRNPQLPHACGTPSKTAPTAANTMPGAGIDASHRPTAARHPHPPRARGRPHRAGRTRSPRRRSRRPAPQPRRTRPPPRRPRPPPLPGRRPRQPARRRQPRSRLERRAARTCKPPTTTTTAPAQPPAALTDEQQNRIRPLATDFPALWSTPHTPAPGTQTHGPPPHRRRHPHQDRPDPPARPLPRRTDHQPHRRRSHPRLASPPNPTPTPSPCSTSSSTATPTPKPPNASTQPVTAPARTNLHRRHRRPPPPQLHPPQPPPPAPRQRPAHHQPKSPNDSACTPPPSNDGTPTTSSPARKPTTRTRSSTTTPAPTPQPNDKATNSAPESPTNQNARHHQPEVQYETQVLSVGFPGRLKVSVTP